MLNQTLTPEQALRALTLDGAYATFQESQKGSIKFGKLADLVVLSDNPLTVPVDEIAEIEVEMTMINGEIVYTKPESPEITTASSSSTLEPTNASNTTTQTSVFPFTSPVPLNIVMFVIFAVIALRKTRRNRQ